MDGDNDEWQMQSSKSHRKQHTTPTSQQPPAWKRRSSGHSRPSVNLDHTTLPHPHEPLVSPSVAFGYTSPDIQGPPFKLQDAWVFWFMHREPGSKITDYNNALKKVVTFSSIEEFWSAYSFMNRPSHLPSISDYQLFKQGIRPIWEDNLNGGKWIVRLRKGISSRLWENLVLAMIGDQFDVGDDICGAVISIRPNEDILSLWNATADDGKINLKIRDALKRILNLPAHCIMEYKAHKSSVADNSSFRNAEKFR